MLTTVINIASVYNQSHVRFRPSNSECRNRKVECIEINLYCKIGLYTDNMIFLQLYIFCIHSQPYKQFARLRTTLFLLKLNVVWSQRRKINWLA